MFALGLHLTSASAGALWQHGIDVERMSPQSGSGVAGVFIAPPPLVAGRGTGMFVQLILNGAGFVGLEDAATAVCPSPLIEVHISEAARDGSAGSPSKAQAMRLRSLSEEAYQAAACRIEVWLIHSGVRSTAPAGDPGNWQWKTLGPA